MAAILEVKGMECKYHTREGTLTALRDVSFSVNDGEIVGIVGESGCGKSTVASALMRLLPPNGEITAGQILLKGQDLLLRDQDGMRQTRGKDVSMILQDPMTSLSPVFSIEQQMVDALAAHRTGTLGSGEGKNGGDQAALGKRAVAMLERVGIPDAQRQIRQYPHQFSGGMRQRIMIAMALLSQPALLIADEPTSALDVTLEAQIIELIRGLRDDLGTSILYITHDLGVVAQLCDRVLVMYAGNVVEAGNVFDIFDSARHSWHRIPRTACMRLGCGRYVAACRVSGSFLRAASLPHVAILPVAYATPLSQSLLRLTVGLPSATPLFPVGRGNPHRPRCSPLSPLRSPSPGGDPRRYPQTLQGKALEKRQGRRGKSSIRIKIR